MLLEVQGVSKTFTSRFGPVAALSEVSLKIGAGECFGLIGESGCGKSTLARIISGTLTPDEGSVSLDGQAVNARSSRSRRAHQQRLQMVFQDPRASFNPRMRVVDALREPLIHKLKRTTSQADGAIRKTMAQVDLASDLLYRRVHAISVGQAQRVAIARALLAEPKLVICDEITSALDVTVQASILELLAELRREVELSMLFISHDIAVVAQLADRVAVMERGKIIEQGPTAQVVGSPTQEYTRLLIELA